MEPIINQEQFLPIIQKEPGGGGSQWESEGREKSRVRHYMKNRYEDKFGKPDKEEEGRRAACEKSQREEGMGGQVGGGRN